MPIPVPEQPKECPGCAFEVPADAEECPYCGYEFPRPKTGVRPMAWLFAALLVIPLAWVAYRFFG